MVFTLESHESPSPLIETAWRAQSAGGGAFASLAVSRTELVITRQRGTTSVVLRGPETRATTAHTPKDAEFFGVTFRLGVFVPALPPARLVDQQVTLPVTGGGSFWLHDHALPLPDLENADLFVERLVRLGLLRAEPLVETLLEQAVPERPATLRTLQRRFLHATGLSQRAVLSIERARRALALLQAGQAIADVVHDLGYTDQPHLTRMLTRLVGRTPARIVAGAWPHAPLTAREVAGHE